MAEKIFVAQREGMVHIKPPENAGKVVSIIYFRDKLFVACEYGMFEYIDDKFHRIKFVFEEEL